jgi:hypothetical protein
MVKNKKRKKPSAKKKQIKKSVSLSRFFDVHTRANHRKISTFKRIVTKQRVYIFTSALVLVIVASTAAYAVMSNGGLGINNPTPSTTNNTSANSKKQTSSSNTTNTSINSTTAQQPATADCYQIDVAAETQFLKSTNVLVYPHYGDSRAVFDAYNNGYQQAYNTYLSSVKAHNCPITITNKGIVQYAAPSCTQAYADNIVVVLRNQINSGVNLDMNEYNEWLRAGHHSSWDSSYQSYASYQQDIANEQNYIQNEDNARVRGYVSQTNTELVSIFCPQLNPANFYYNMF